MGLTCMGACALCALWGLLATDAVAGCFGQISSSVVVFPLHFLDLVSRMVLHVFMTFTVLQKHPLHLQSKLCCCLPCLYP